MPANLSMAVTPVDGRVNGLFLWEGELTGRRCHNELFR